jgi:hypothetical protein
MNEAVRQAAMYDPKTKKLSYIDLCFHAHHLNFAEDANNTLWFNDLGMGHSIFAAEHPHVGPDARRAEIAGVDGPRARHQRQRQARCVRGAEGSDRPGEGQVDRRRVV